MLRIGPKPFSILIINSISAIVISDINVPNNALFFFAK